MILNCPMEPLILFEGDSIPTQIDPATGITREYYVIRDQNDAELFNEAVRRSGAQCRAAVRANCQFYRDNRVAVVCLGQTRED